MKDRGPWGMYCNLCGEENPLKANFCSSCGGGLSNLIESEDINQASSETTSNFLKSRFQERTRVQQVLIVLCAIWVVVSVPGIVSEIAKNVEPSNQIAEEENISTPEVEIPQDDSQPSYDSSADERVIPDPETGVDIYSLPTGNAYSTAYDYGVQQAESFISAGGLTRAIYGNLGGLQQSCKMILDTFMLLSGGSSTRQEYADFLYGCTVTVKRWY